MNKKRLKNKGVSPVIATVLLVAMVVVIALIIFLWFRGITQEAITKFGGTNVELVCNDVSFDASYSGYTLYIINNGNVPIFGIKLKTEWDGGYQMQYLNEITTSWPNAGLNQGGSFSAAIGLGEEINKITLIPVLMGNSKKGEKTFMCNENQHGYEISIE